MRIHLDTGVLRSSDEPAEASWRSSPSAIRKSLKFRFTRAGAGSGTQVIPGQQQANGHCSALNNELIRAVVLGHSWRNELLSGRANTMVKISRAGWGPESLRTPHLAGSFPGARHSRGHTRWKAARDLSVLELRQPIADWEQQRRLLGFRRQREIRAKGPQKLAFLTLGSKQRH